jgi:inositol transport system ATP-binding protein
MTVKASRPTLLRMTGISKSFPGVRALDQVDFEVGEAEIHAFLGENGAGKSTLLKILSGAQPPDAGTIEFAGNPVSFASPQAAQAAGIVTIYQEFTLAPDMTVAENIFIGREPGSRMFINFRELEDQSRKLCQRIGLERSPRALVRDLSVAEQ